MHRLGEKYTIQNITKTLMTNPYYIQNEYRQYIKKPLLAKLENELLKNNGKNDFASTVGDLIGLLVLMVITMVLQQVNYLSVHGLVIIIPTGAHNKL